jgi:hypothetical protein
METSMGTTSLAGNGTDRFKWESRTRPLVEQVINQAFPKIYDLRWTADCKSEIHLDRQHGIDIISMYITGQPLSFQAKVLGTNYTTLTIEGLNRHTDGPGDWEECLADYIVWLYSTDGQTIDRWAVVSRPMLTIATAEGRIRWSKLQPASNAGSCFYYVEFGDVLENAPETVRAWDGEWSLSE